MVARLPRLQRLPLLKQQRHLQRLSQLRRRLNRLQPRPVCTAIHLCSQP